MKTKVYILTLITLIGFMSCEKPLTDDEIWELVDYMKTFYTLRETAELFKHGYSWQTGRAKIDQLQNEEQYDLINKVLLPEVFKRIQYLFEKN